ncbi:hypothetical protein K431DRAFT_348767 [Polychaeton citri CBS 116435]|uniref:CHAT domain-containing protein n=1 Tax=Polychaeton citri CBS 116435 TaxID=1314669 RepID=A0A9P4Q2Q5_9PEZI|nr:hypothetical protein K431DRAFT_348767 [Polychaeton citri CBS 116435]
MDLRQIADKLGGSIVSDDYRGNFKVIENDILIELVPAPSRSRAQQCETKLLYAAFSILRGDLFKADELLGELLNVGSDEADGLFYHRCQTYHFYLTSLREVPAILRFRGLLENTAALMLNASLNMIERLEELENQRKLLIEVGAGDLDVVESKLFVALHTYNTELQIYSHSHPEHWVNNLRVGSVGKSSDRRISNAQVDSFPQEIHDVLKQHRLIKVDASLARLSTQLQFATNLPSSMSLLENLCQNTPDDPHSSALLYMLKGDAMLSPPFTSPIALNLIALTQGPGWTHERWDGLEDRFPLRSNDEALRMYDRALRTVANDDSPRLRAAVKLRIACLQHMEGLYASINTYPRALRNWTDAEQNLNDARAGFYGDCANLLVVDAHLLLLNASRNGLGTVGNAVSKGNQLGKDAYKRGNASIAQFIGCLILRYARWRFVAHRRADIANACCAAARALYAACRDRYMELQSVIAHADLLEKCRDLEGAQLKIDDAWAEGGVVDEAMQHFGQMIRSASNTSTLRQAWGNALDHFDRIANSVYQAIGRADLLTQWRVRKQILEKVSSPPALPPRPTVTGPISSPPPLPPRRQAGSSPSNIILPRVQDVAVGTGVRRKGRFQRSSDSQQEGQTPSIWPNIDPRDLIDQMMNSRTAIQQQLISAAKPMQSTQQLLGVYNETMEQCYILLDRADLDGWRLNLETFIETCNTSHRVPPNMTALYKLICFTHLGKLGQARELLPEALPLEFGGTGPETILDQFRPLALAVGMQDFLPKWKAQSAERAISFAVLAQDWAKGREVLAQVIRDLPNFATPQGLSAETETWQLVSWIGAIHEHAGRPEEAFTWYLNALHRLEGLRNAANIEARRNCHSTIHSGEIYAALVRMCLQHAERSDGRPPTDAITYRNPRDWALGQRRTWPDQALMFLEQSRARTLLDILVTKQKADPQKLVLRQFLMTASTTLKQNVPQGMDDAERLARLRQLIPGLPTGAGLRNALREARETLDMEQKGSVSMYNLTAKEVEAPVLYGCIPQGAVAIQILPSRKGTSLMCISNKGVDAVHRSEITDIQLRTLVLPYVKEAQSEHGSKEKLKNLASAISQLVLLPFESQVRRSRTVIFVHSHALQAFPCTGYILDELPLFLQKIVYQVPSLSVLYHLKQIRRKKPGRKISAIVSSSAAGGDFDADTSGKADRRIFLIAAEGTAIASTFGSQPIDLDGELDKLDDNQQSNHLSHLFKTSSIVWIATHGTAIHTSPWQSYLHARPRFRVLDMAALENCAPLVVFTACWAGLGSATVGNDILGFAHAVLASGSQVFVAGLWTLEETASMLLMVLFFREVAANDGGEVVGELWRRALVALYYMTPDSAQTLFRDIQRAWQTANQYGPVLKGFNNEKVEERLEWLIEDELFPDFQHPFHWAAYNMIGDGDLVL